MTYIINSIIILLGSDVYHDCQNRMVNFSNMTAQKGKMQKNKAATFGLLHLNSPLHTTVMENYIREHALWGALTIQELFILVIHTVQQEMQLVLPLKKSINIHRFTYPKGVHSYRYFLQPMRTPNLLMHIFILPKCIYAWADNIRIWGEELPVWVYPFWVCRHVNRGSNRGWADTKGKELLLFDFLKHKESITLVSIYFKQRQIEGKFWKQILHSNFCLGGLSHFLRNRDLPIVPLDLTTCLQTSQTTKCMTGLAI